MTYPTKMHLVSAGRPLCTRTFGPVNGVPRKAFFELEPQHRCAKCEAKAAKLGFAPIVPHEVKSGSKEHLDALSKFFGI
jgi:hypothetical protein